MSQALMVGYLESWGNITFTEAADKGYDAIVMAFGTINGTTVDIFNGIFNPSPTPDALKSDISEAKAKGAKQILFSVGGDKNTYHPNGASVSDVAQAVVSYLQEYGFTGIDFDLEIDTDADYLDQLCAEIKTLDSSMLITAAPQVNQNDHSTDLFLVSTGTYQIYDQAVANRRFDYLFIQAYNNGWPVVDGCSQKDVCFVSKAFESLKHSIPAETMITIGEPASINAAGETSIFHGPDAGNDIYNLLADQYRLIRDDVQFGGAMVWNVNWDQKNNYQFVNAIGNAISHLGVL